MEEEKKLKYKNAWIFGFEYAYIYLLIYIIISTISLFISLHCNDIFSFETIVAVCAPFIYLPVRYYFHSQCIPAKICIL